VSSSSPCEGSHKHDGYPVTSDSFCSKLEVGQDWLSWQTINTEFKHRRCRCF
jgi:hypothetical protein